MLKKFVLVILLGSFLSCQSQAISDSQKQADLMLSVFILLSRNHFIEKNLNQAFFDEVLTNYLEITDRQKLFFTKSEIDVFYQLSQYKGQGDPNQEVYERLPNLLKISYQTFEVLEPRIQEFSEFAENYLGTELNYRERESFVIDPNDRVYVSEVGKLKENWKRYLKYLTLNRLLELNKSVGEDKTVRMGSPQFISNETQARKLVTTQMKSLAQNLGTFKQDQYLDFYLNAMGLAYDQYTSYYSPVENQNFTIQMTGQLEGIGAQIAKVDDGTIEIRGIVPGGPTYKQKALEVGDKIMAVADDKNEMIDVIPLSINEALQYIRGKKGTIARLKVKRVDGMIDEVKIVRDRVVLEESYARSSILDIKLPGEPNRKIGYLYLPSFYGDSRNPNAPNSSEDVKRELLKLNASGVDALVFDLRNNGGGRLDDAVQISGFFIKEGPIVRVRNRATEMEPRYDIDPNVYFDKPMVVLVNENSASASEIFAAAMQDYGRAVVVGGESTFGKATVQTIFEYDREEYFASINDIAGSLKFTIQKYYRATGKSTQTIGVIPDIMLPSISYKEENKKNPYKLDSLPQIPFQKWQNFSYDIDALKRESKKRVVRTPFFNNMDKRTALIKNQLDNKEMSLQYVIANREQERYLRELKRHPIDMKKTNSKYSVSAHQGSITADTPQETKDKYANWEKQILEDYYIEEATLILHDIIKG